MQDRPDLQSMLSAVAAFLEREAVPATADPSVAFRLRIAAHLCAMGAREVHHEGQDDAADLDALEALVGEAPLAPAERRDRVARRQAIRMLERRLGEQIDADEDDAAASADALQAMLGRRLRVANPRFDLREDLP